MREQMAKIIDVAASPKVTMQVVPFEAGAHPAVDNTFTLLEFNNAALSPVVFVENLAGTFYLERDAEIQRYREVLEYLKASALSPASSIRSVEDANRKFESV